MNILKNIGKIASISTLLVALAGLAILNSNASAQEKGAEKLMKLPKPGAATQVKPARAADQAAMSCPKCIDSRVTVTQAVGRGGRHEIATVTKHECPDCSTKIITSGIGKSAKDAVQHVCKHSATGSSSCCAMNKTAN